MPTCRDRELTHAGRVGQEGAGTGKAFQKVSVPSVGSSAPNR